MIRATYGLHNGRFQNVIYVNGVIQPQGAGEVLANDDVFSNDDEWENAVCSRAPAYTSTEDVEAVALTGNARKAKLL